MKPKLRGDLRLIGLVTLAQLLVAVVSWRGGVTWATWQTPAPAACQGQRTLGVYAGEWDVCPPFYSSARCRHPIDMEKIWGGAVIP